MKRYNHSEKFGLTTTKETIIFWHAARAGNKDIKVFSNKKGEKGVLAPDNGYAWKSAKKAPYCEYMQVWFGDFPYGSYCWAIRRCTVTGKVEIEVLETEINPRGETMCDRWERECNSYVPDSIPADYHC